MSHDAIYLQKNNIKPYTKPIHTVKSQVTDTNSCQKNSSHKYTNATAFSNAAIRFIRPAHHHHFHHHHLTKQCELRTPCGTLRTARGTRVTSRPISGRVRMLVRILLVCQFAVRKLPNPASDYSVTLITKSEIPIIKSGHFARSYI